MFCEILECPRNIGRKPRKSPPLLQTLGRLINHTEYTEKGIIKMPLEEKCRHIKADSVTCERYFDYRFEEFFPEIMCHSTHPVEEIADFFYRIKFQQRGSPHVHMLLWIKNVPTAESNTAEEISEFVDKYVACSKENVDPYLINYQTQRHARTCLTRNKPICRLNFAIPPMPHTTILHPRENKDLLPEAHKDYEAICNFFLFSRKQ